MGNGKHVEPLFMIYLLWVVSACILIVLHRRYFTPRREAAKAAPKGSTWYSFHLIGVGNGSGGFTFTVGGRPFWNFENVLSPGGKLRKQLPSQLILFPFNWCRKRFWGFQIYGGWEAFLKFWKCFIPRWDSTKQIPKEVQLFWRMSYFVLGNV